MGLFQQQEAVHPNSLNLTEHYGDIPQTTCLHSTKKKKITENPSNKVQFIRAECLV
jgi:hypothetical protein